LIEDAVLSFLTSLRHDLMMSWIFLGPLHRCLQATHRHW
jgi:hypothetical protein